MWSKTTKRKINYLADINETTITRKEQLIYDTKVKNVNQEAENDEKLEKFTVSYRDNALGQWKKLKACEKYEGIRYAQYTIELFKLIK